MSEMATAGARSRNTQRRGQATIADASLYDTLGFFRLFRFSPNKRLPKKPILITRYQCKSRYSFLLYASY
jgi:hypothetical protein